MAEYATNVSGAILLPSSIQVTESISGSVVPLAMFFCEPLFLSLHFSCYLTFPGSKHCGETSKGKDGRFSNLPTSWHAPPSVWGLKIWINLRLLISECLGCCWERGSFSKGFAPNAEARPPDQCTGQQMYKFETHFYPTLLATGVSITSKNGVFFIKADIWGWSFL